MPAVSALSSTRQECSSIASTERPSEKSSPCRRLMYAGRPRAASPSPNRVMTGPLCPRRRGSIGMIAPAGPREWSFSCASLRCGRSCNLAEGFWAFPARSSRPVSAALGVVADEVRQGFRIHLGSGFESKLLASEGPLILDNLANEEVLSPTLRAAQIHSILGAPLVVGERHIGIIHLGLASPRRFTADEVELIQRVADRVALAVAHARAIDELQRANKRWRGRPTLGP